ncbi:MAG: septum formation initiator family protein [Acidimicrobiia bacterium]|nr:septum formation initiator family protein [Acidimicrobiia bacterium]
MEARQRRSVLLPLIMLGIVLVAAVDVFPIRQLVALNGEAADLRVQLTEIQEQNAQLEREVELLHSPTEIERIARADFGYVNPGETSYVVIMSDEPRDPETSQGGSSEVVPESGGFWEALWDFLTGRDMSNG